MNIFITGASGYIGGSVAATFLTNGHSVSGLVRSEARADDVRKHGIEPVLGTLDDLSVLQVCAAKADVVVNAANADHEFAAVTLLEALEGTEKTFIHTSGSSVVGTQAEGRRVDDIYDETTPFTPSPGRAARAALNQRILDFTDRGVRSIIICPSLIYGLGHGVGKHSMQAPWLIKTARKHGIAKHYGPGENIWSNVHIDDLVVLYLLALTGAPAGGFYYAENGANLMKDMCNAINRMLGFAGGSQSMSLQEASEEWGEGPAKNTMGSNSRVKAARARAELGWAPTALSLIDEIERGCYADT